MKAVICPVCNGTGKIYDQPDWGSAAVDTFPRKCHGCNGGGWVAVPEDNEPKPAITMYHVPETTST